MVAGSPGQAPSLLQLSLDLCPGMRDNPMKYPDKVPFPFTRRSWGESMRAAAFSRGTVGIGTASPQSKLAVNGTITAKEVEVTATGWPDYVFADDYDLMPLNDVAAYIKANGRLPEVPSSDEVSKNGINLGATQALLLKKIEELTLYMIEMKRENLALQARVAELGR